MPIRPTLAGGRARPSAAATHRIDFATEPPEVRGEEPVPDVLIILGDLPVPLSDGMHPCGSMKWPSWEKSYR
ncbi:uncharacterized protein N7529_012026 [Penicillium soppii]|uniref:uncharacterized protein n=1 Tax=Penicillium soppii TaxID=69789 RepID=UPI00254712DC|nr:uncharacterized protein N7529_012026 [Penicillium soppii]KAJ5852641.1 hypothetical protein N7529_012026 [Penicillium soppii]